ncbi:hypothetical protein FRACA_1050023 [Frankia canadensis]|uniref:Uncharacterized protein n=1 Tax=Frankia canadensis TaxID=1836972 RepID=A0A2I2KIZ5_9ACTN|nr:hypothetical protein FRACA_1050023 [Frankia canadensis]SOU52929.1 hypothetical protein FRACA_1050023 [Frankia canadensis]
MIWNALLPMLWKAIRDQLIDGMDGEGRRMWRRSVRSGR